MIRKCDSRIREQEIGGDVGGRRPFGKPKVRWKDAFCRYAADLLQIRNWKAARSGKVWKKTIGKAITRKRAETPKKRKKKRDKDAFFTSNQESE